MNTPVTEDTAEPGFFSNHAIVRGYPEETIDQKAIDGHAGELARCYALSEEASQVIDLAVVTAAIGPVRRVRDPLMPRSIPISLNAIVTAPAKSMAQAAVTVSSAPLMAVVKKALSLNQALGVKKLRQRRIELEAICASFLAQLRDPNIPPQQPLTIPAPAEIARKDAQAEILPECLKAASAAMEHELVERPWIVAQDLRPDELSRLRGLSFDGFLTVFGDADVLSPVMAKPARKRHDLAQALRSGWTGSLGQDGGIGNVWLVTPAIGDRLFGDPCMETALPTFLVADGADTGGDLKPLPATPDWNHFIVGLLDTRLRRETLDFVLNAGATTAFLTAFNRVRRDSPSEVLTAWSEQCLKVAAAIHVMTGHVDDAEIGEDVLNRAVGTLSRSEEARARLRTRSAATSHDEKVEVMVRKLQNAGPLTRRALFRKYDRHDHARHAPVLDACLARGLVCEIGGKYAAVHRGGSDSATVH